MPHVATSTADLLSTIRAAAHLDGDLLVIDDEAAFRSTAIRDLAWTAAFSTDEATTAAAQWIVWEASQALGALERQHPGPVHGPRPRRGGGLHRPGHQPARPDLRHGPDGLRGRRQRRRRRRHLRDRPQRADLHVPAPDRLRDLRPGRGDRRRLARPGVHPGRPLPVQRQEVRRRPRGDDRGDPARLPPRHRCRLSQHRHRLLDARRPVEADGRRAAARELRARGRADRAHPDARDRRRHRQRRWRDRRGRVAELDRRGAAGVPRRLPARARCAHARRDRVSARSASRPARATAACRCPTAASPRSSSISTSSASSATSPGASTARPGRSSTARPPCPTSCSTASRRSRRPRSTSRPASRTRSTTTPRSRRTSAAPSRPGASRTPPTSARPDQTDEQFVYTTRKKAIGPFKRELWDLDDQGRDPGHPAPQVLVPVHRARRQRLARDDRRLHPPGRGPPPIPDACARRSRPAEAASGHRSTMS